MKFNAMRYRIPVLKRLIPSIKKRLAKIGARNGYFIGSSQGAYYLLNTENFVDRQIAFYDDFERRQCEIVFGPCGKGADLFLDIGANIGYYSVLAAMSGAAEKVVAFEPDPRNALQLGSNILINNLKDKIEIRREAVSSESGKARFVPGPDRSTGQSRVDRSATEFLDVDAVRIDDLIRISDRRIVAKIDIEGHELDAVRGMRGLITGNDVLLQIECYGENIPALTDLLAGMGAISAGQIEHDFYFATSPDRAEAVKTAIAAVLSASP